MRVLILRGTSLGGGKDCHPGDTPDLPDGQAADLIKQGRAAQVQEIQQTIKKRKPKEPAPWTNSQTAP